MTLFISRLLSIGLTLAAAFALPTPPARAMTVIPPTFDELVTRADAVFTGDVLGVRSEWAGEGATKRIVSYATFNVLRVMKGQAASPYTLRMLGGTVGTRTLVVMDAPKFVTGDRVIVFVKDNGKQFFPAVGIMHGVYRLERPATAPATAGGAAAPEMVIDHTGRALESVDEIGKDPAARQARHLAGVQGGSAAASTGLTREQFESKIVERVQALGLQ